MKAKLLIVLAAGSIAAAQTNTNQGPPIGFEHEDAEGFTTALLDSLEVLPGEIGPLPATPIPDDNPLTAQKVSLGHKLFFDPRLSGTGTMSCASCHDPSHGWADPKALSIGHESKELGRHSPTVINTAHNPVQMWDGRFDTLEQQAQGPIMADAEMAMGSVEDLEAQLNAIPEYRDSIREVYGTEPTIEAVASAIAAFERAYAVTGKSRFDFYASGDKQALSYDEKRGLILFVGKARCTACHSGTNFTDNKFHNLGVGFDKADPDLGRFAVTEDNADMGAFKTPTLRNIAQTAPYMHDGSQSTLEEVVRYYNDGGHANPHLDEEIEPLDLTEREIAQLVAFMEALTGPLPVVQKPVLPPDATGVSVAAVAVD